MWALHCVSANHCSYQSTTKVTSFTHSVPWNKALTPCSCAHADRGMRPSFHKLYFCCLGKHSKTETGFKMNFLPMKRENSNSSYCVVLTFKVVKRQWLVKEILVFWSPGHILFMDDDSEHKVDDLMDGCLILNKLVRRRVKLCQRVMAILHCSLMNCKHFYQVFPVQTQLCSS